MFFYKLGNKKEQSERHANAACNQIGDC